MVSQSPPTLLKEAFTRQMNCWPIRVGKLKLVPPRGGKCLSRKPTRVYLARELKLSPFFLFLVFFNPGITKCCLLKLPTILVQAPRRHWWPTFPVLFSVLFMTYAAVIRQNVKQTLNIEFIERCRV